MSNNYLNGSKSVIVAGANMVVLSRFSCVQLFVTLWTVARAKSKGKLIYESYSRVIVITKIRESFPERLVSELTRKAAVLEVSSWEKPRPSTSAASVCC